MFSFTTSVSFLHKARGKSTTGTEFFTNISDFSSYNGKKEKYIRSKVNM